MNNDQKLNEIHQYIKDIRDNIVQINTEIQNNPRLETIIKRAENELEFTNKGYAKLIVLNAYLHMKSKFEELPDELDKRIRQIQDIIKN